jgi:hypothetical protein
MTGGVIGGKDADGTPVGNDLAAAGTGGGVYVGSNAAFTLSGGEISNNGLKATGLGGGVYALSAAAGPAVFTMTGGTIEGNEALFGGGVNIKGVNGQVATFTMSGGDIKGNVNNTATSAGGGVYVGVYSTFTMNRNEAVTPNTTGTISGNKAYAAGGGVFVNATGSGVVGTFNMNAGTIKANQAGFGDSSSANAKGGGVYLAFSTSSGVLNVTAGAVITGSDTVNTADKNTLTGNASITAGGVAIYAAASSPKRIENEISGTAAVGFSAGGSESANGSNAQSWTAAWTT